ncbi:outer membrane autotransporter barrel domain-containing protein [Pseudomonas sp. GM102]|uniref:autotransporter outer membrane beta-barrel domain-containing protein n=1 Tax=Pseudomonas sp. GM102 TaxID=1144321 RepID=UPI00026F4B8F|nr:autotransporter outer membrane beta-barrel domain-containing protein [Pseudomonas sp. GM102]EJM05516.1 outer membrane autotransporter barrel domain-containing protein [Pseudomonas sp. GM102]
MPIRRTFRPHSMALAISLALGHAGSAIAQQPASIPPTSADQMAWIEAFIKDPDTVTTKVTKAESGPEGIALKLGDAHDLVTVSGRGRFNGLVDGGGGTNVLQLDVASGGGLGESRNFNVLHIKRGQWTLTGTDDFRDGAVLMGNAVLTNRGRIAGPVSIDTRATFRGNGHVGQLTVAGRLEVNALYGAPQVSGNLELHDSAELAYEVNADGRSETIKVDGTASLGDATLKIVAAPGDYPVTSEYRVIEAGKVQGQFGKVLNDLAFMTPTLHYDDGKSVDLTYARNDVPIERLAITENGRELAQSIEESTYIPQPQAPSVTAAKPSTQLNAAVTALLGSSKATATYAIEQLAGGSNANLANATLSSVKPVSGSMLSAMRQLDSSDLNGQSGAPRLAAGGEATGRVWLQALGHGGTLDRGHGSSALQHSTKGLVLGADWALDEQWRVGVIGGQSQTRLDGSQLDGELDSWHLGAYALRQSGPLALRLGATHSNHDGSTKRRVAFNGFSDRPKGSYNASTQQAFTEVGYNLGRGNLSAEPFANIGYQRYQRDSYTEKGGAAALQVHGQTQNNFSTTFGLRLAQLKTLDNGMQLTPRFSAGWKHTYGDVDSKTQQRLATGGKNYIVEGAALDRDSLMLDAGLELAVSTRHTFGVGYNGEIGNDGRSHGVMGQWRMAF